MKNDRVYIAIVAGLFVFLVIGILIQPKKISWEPTYSRKSKDPFASRALYEMLGDVFAGQPIENLRIPPYEFAYGREKDSLSDQPIVYMLLGHEDALRQLNAKAIWRMAQNGDHIFIASEYLYGALSDSLGIYSVPYFDPEDYRTDKDTIRLNFTQPGLYSSKGFPMRPDDNMMYVYIPDSIKQDVNILSVNSKGKPVFVKRKVGKGAIYFHSVPLAFTNYYMIYAGNEGYISRCLSFLPVAPVYWDDFFREGRTESISPIRVILNSPSLRMAYILLLVLLALYMLFQSKRKQRVIPVIKPYENSTLAFVETIAKLYYSKGNHTALIKKKLVYFSEKIRLRYQISIDVKNEENILAVSARSGVEEATVRKLFKFMDYIQRAYNLTETELIHFNKSVEEFWQKASK